MLADLLLDEILSNPDWRDVKKFNIACSKLFRYKFFSELVNGYMTLNIVKDTMFGNKHELIERYMKYVYPNDIIVEFFVTLPTGYQILKSAE